MSAKTKQGVELGPRARRPRGSSSGGRAPHQGTGTLATSSLTTRSESMPSASAS